jgi:hypothetical protein
MIQATTAKVAQQTELKPLHNNIDMNKFEYLNGSGYRYKLGYNMVQRRQLWYLWVDVWVEID